MCFFTNDPGRHYLYMVAGMTLEEAMAAEARDMESLSAALNAAETEKKKENEK